MFFLTMLMYRMSQSRAPNIGLENLLSLNLVAFVCIPGGMTLYNLADYNGLKIIVFILLYFYIKNNTVNLRVEGPVEMGRVYASKQ